MPATLQSTRFLNGAGKACSEQDALLKSTITRVELPNLQSQEDYHQHVLAYNPNLGKLAETWSKNNKPEPLGIALQDETKTIAGYTFYHTGMGTWQYETSTCKIEINSATDVHNAETWLQTFKLIEEKIIDRGISGGKISFELGGLQYHPSGTSVAEAIKTMQLIRFPATQNGSHLLGVCLELGSKQTKEEVSLQGIILHEIGHLLEPKLNHHINALQMRVIGKLSEIQEDLKQISPHYLGKSAPAIIAKFQKLQKIGAEKETDKFAIEIAAELFAELMRYFYLEPALTGKIPKQKETTWLGFNEAVAVLQKEANYNLRNKKGASPLFPEKGRFPKIIPKFIQDIL